MIANIITLFRLFLTFIVITILGRHLYIDIVCLVAIALIYILDAVDGFVARRQEQTTTFGAVFDVAVAFL